MAKRGEGKDRRVYPRVDIPKSAKANADEASVEGAVGDVSAGGILLRTDDKLELGQEVLLEIEDMSPVSGKVSRVTECGFVVALELPRDAEDKFLAEVMQIQNNIDVDNG